MKIAALLGWIIVVLILGLTPRSLPAQETMRVAIPLLPTPLFPCLWLTTGAFSERELDRRDDPNQQRANNLSRFDIRRWARPRGCF
jgi:hypothetical protein